MNNGLRAAAVGSAMVLGLAACGGGDSDSGGGQANLEKVNYVGTQTIILSATGVGSVREEADFSLVYDPSVPEVTVVDEDFSISAPILGGSAYGDYLVTSPAITIALDSTTNCTGSVSYNGAISPTLTNGNLSGSFDCGGGLTIVVSGNYSATP